MDKDKGAKWLLRSAWVVEILAATMGITIGCIFLYLSLKSGGTGELNTGNEQIIISILPALAFFIIAVVELSRIPFAYTIYRSRGSFKSLFVFTPVLLFLIFINFESMYVAFTIYVDNITKQSSIIQNSIESKNREIQNIENEILYFDNLTEENIVKEYNDEVQNYRKQRDDIILPLEEQKSELLESVGGPEIKILEKEILELGKEIKKYETDSDKAINQQIKTNQSEQKKLETQLGQKTLQRDKYQEQLSEKGLIFNSSGKKELIKKIADLDSIITQLNNKLLNDLGDIRAKEKKSLETIIKPLKIKIDDKKEKINELTLQSSTGIQSEIDILNDEIKHENEKFKDLLIVLDGKKKTKEKQLDDQETELGLLNDKKFQLDSDLKDLKDKKTKSASYGAASTYFKMAKQITNIYKDIDSIADLTEKDLDIATNIWFGGLALLVASTGTMLAFASFTVGDIERSTKRTPVRSLLLANLKYLRKPRIKIHREIVEKEKIVEVTKVVPEEKVIFKEVPKIHEVVKKEIEYIPVPTAREDLINYKNEKEKGKDKDTK